MTSIAQEFHIKHHLLREHLTFLVTGDTLTECLEKANQYARELEKYIKISFKFVNDIEGNVKLTFKTYRGRRYIL